jgi:UDP-2,3-diacylglucosamine hydrolase
MSRFGRLALIAGNGQFPVEFLRNATASGTEVFVLAHQGETDPTVEQIAKETTWIRIGQLGRLLKELSRWKITDAVFLGGISRGTTLKNARPDWKGIQLLTKLRSVKDDALLRAIVEEVEKCGVTVHSPAVFLASSVPNSGYLTTRILSEAELKDADIGWEAATVLGQLDIGQTVVVKNGVVVAVEAAEGTDQTIVRAGSIAGTSCVVVKRAKPQQDLRLDIPSVGMTTLRSMATSEATALLLEAQKCMILNPSEFIREANRLNIAVLVRGE